MSGVQVEDFIRYWEAEGAAYTRQGDYAWMAGLVPGGRVLEIGCGLGFGTRALVDRGLQVLALEMLAPCLDAARERLAGAAGVSFLAADLERLEAASLQVLADFRPDVLVCWLMGAPQDSIRTPGQDAQAAVAAFRERIHRQVAELAVRLPEVQAVHIVDRTAIPWQAKDLGRDTLVRYHQLKTFAGLPFTIGRQDALYRKLAGGADLDALRRSHPALKRVVPVLASLVARRKP